MAEINPVITDVWSGEAQQTTRAQVTMSLEAVCATENAPAETRFTPYGFTFGSTPDPSKREQRGKCKENAQYDYRTGH